jgi:protein involved in polysaccharide export with SLBB domain
MNLSHFPFKLSFKRLLQVSLSLIWVLVCGVISAQEIDPAKARAAVDSARKGGADTAAVRVARQTVPAEVKTTPVAAPASNVFGSQLFTTASLSFEPNLRIATPPNYVLGPDDELLVVVYGFQEATIKLQVLPEGNVYIPQVGSIPVAGLTVEAATKRIQQKMANTAYRTLAGAQSKLGITLTKIKSIRITILGANKPGNYTVSSLATVFNALYLAGGPDNEVGSYRNIQLIRNNQLFKTIDLYDFLVKGNAADNILLKENDVINIPVYQKRVTLRGEIKKQGVFELKDGENLTQLIQFAGGYTDNAYKAILKIQSNTDKEQVVKDITQQAQINYIPASGDRIQVPRILNRIDNAVELNGAVYRPGQYEFTEGLTLKTLIQKADGLLPDAYTEKALISRNLNDVNKQIIEVNLAQVLNGGNSDIILQKRDQITLFTKAEMKDLAQVEISGEVRKPGSFPFQQGMNLQNVLLLAGGFKEGATLIKIELSSRIKQADGVGERDTLTYVREIDLSNGNSLAAEKISINPYDKIVVRKLPSYAEQRTVTIEGEVLYPGVYTLSTKKERISDLLKKSGGFTKAAFPNAVYLIRTDKSNATLKAQKAAIVEGIQKSIRDSTSGALEEVTAPISKIAIDVTKVLESPGAKEDLLLEEGDLIEVPRFESLVKISGQVYTPTKVNYAEGRGLHYYIGAAGGKADYARLSRAYVIYPNGKVRKTHHYLFGLVRVYPHIREGAEIVVPRRNPNKRFSFQDGLGLTTSLLSLVTLTVVTLNALK